MRALRTTRRLLAAVTLVTDVAAAQIDFLAARTYDTACAASALVTADFNGDGVLDVVVAGHTSGAAVSLLLGDGAGGFGAPRTFATSGSQALGVAVADFDNDQDLDLAVAEIEGEGITLLLGDGAGGFGPSQIVESGFWLTAVVAADFDRDGNMDLAATRWSHYVVLLRGDGAGNFIRLPLVSCGYRPDFIRAADFNEDGNPDLMLPGNSGDAAIFFGRGGFDFTGPAYVRSNGVSYDVAVVDLNGDQHVDLVLGDGQRHTVTTVLGNGRGQFSPPRPFAAGDRGIALFAGDVDGDSLSDVVISSEETVNILRGDGSGNLGSPSYYHAGSYPIAAVARDFDRDGDMDVAVADAQDRHVVVLSAEGGADFTTALFLPVIGSFSDVVTADVNGDSNADLVLADDTLNELRVLLADESGGYNPMGSFPVRNAYPVSLVAEDLNGDRQLDLAVANYGSANVSVFLGDGLGGFTAIANLPVGLTPQCVVSGDFDRDGDVDLATASYYDGDISILLGHGTGLFAPAHAIQTDAGGDCLVAIDLNHDRIDDLVMAGSGLSGGVVSLLGDGEGDFGPPLYAILPGYHPSVAAADFDEDGNVDTALSDESGDGAILLGDGGGGFVPVGSFPASERIVAGDLDGDGHADIAASERESVQMFRGDGTGTFFPVAGFGAAGDLSRTVTDLDRDGRLDLVTTGSVLYGRTLICPSPCLEGTVNLGEGPVARTLSINGSTGGPDGVISIGVGTPVDVHLATAPAGPSRANYVLWLWAGCPETPRNVIVGGEVLGCLVNPSPGHTGSSPQPIRCLRGSAVPVETCSGVEELGRGPARAPWYFQIQRGAARPRVLTVQGVLEDTGAMNALGFSITNALVLEIR